MRRIGIDFGTSSVKGAEKRKNGDVTYINLGKKIDVPMIPDVILYEKKEDDEKMTVHFGHAAAARGNITPEDTIRDIKSCLRENDWSRTLSFGEVINGRRAMTDAMRKLYETICSADKDISATITMPVNFSRRQRRIIERAASDAGFDIEAVITEPFAALFYLMRETMGSDTDDHKVLIFDFGGGTLDLCLAEIRRDGERARVITDSTVGMNCGGNDIDRAILDDIFRRSHGDAVKAALDDQTPFHRAINFFNIMDAIGDAKKDLFGGESPDEAGSTEVISKLHGGDVVDFGELTVGQIYSMLDAGGWADKVRRLLDRLFDDASLLPSDVTDVFTIGGSSSNPYFRKVLSDYLEAGGSDRGDALFELNDAMDREDRTYWAVSKGAAIYSELVEAGEIDIRDKIPFMVYSKDAQGRERAKIDISACYKDSRSPWAPLDDEMKASGKIPLYQKIYGEDDREVFLGTFELDDECAEFATLYCFTVDKDRNVTVGLVEGLEGRDEPEWEFGLTYDHDE